MTQVLAPDVVAIHREPPEGSRIAFELRVPAAGPGIDGHFPEQPILAGVMQLEWAQRLAREHFGIEAPVRGLAAIKFHKVIRPGATALLDLEHDAKGGSLAFAFRDAGHNACSSGRFLF